MTEYHVTRQNGYYDEEPRVEIALGPDEVSPGCLVSRYEWEGYYDDAESAADAALRLAVKWAKDDGHDGRYAVTVSAGASIGCYPTADDNKEDVELREWAARRLAQDNTEAVDDDEEGWDDE